MGTIVDVGANVVVGDTAVPVSVAIAVGGTEVGSIISVGVAVCMLFVGSESGFCSSEPWASVAV